MNHFLGHVACAQIATAQREQLERLRNLRQTDGAKAFAEYLGTVVAMMMEQMIDANDSERAAIAGGVTAIRAALLAVYEKDFAVPKKERRDPEHAPGAIY